MVVEKIIPEKLCTKLESLGKNVELREGAKRKQSFQRLDHSRG